MNIVVIGIGKVGYVLLQQLAEEGHDVVAVDRNTALLHMCQNKLDVATVTGNGASVEVQKEAGVETADLLVAATSSDEVNLLCCLVAHKLGCTNVVARVRNPDYDQQLSLLKDELGLSFSINPEKTAADEIFRLIQFPTLLKREFFAGGRTEMAEVKIPEDSRLAGKRLDQLGDILRRRAIVCAVNRQGTVHIPSGPFVLQAGDKVTVSAASREMPRLIRECGIKTRRINRVLIIGGSTIAAYLTRLLLESKVSVAIIEESRERCERLAELLPGAAVICGNGTDQELLLDEGIKEADAVVTLTGIDEENFLVSMFANHLGVPKTITKINRLEYSDVFTGTGIDTIVSPKLLTANQIVRYVRAVGASREGGVETLYRIVGGTTDALGFTVPEGAPFLNVPLMRLHLKPKTLIASIVRRQRVIIPKGDDCLLAGDSVVIVAEASQAVSNLTDIFADSDGFHESVSEVSEDGLNGGFSE